MALQAVVDTWCKIQVDRFPSKMGGMGKLVKTGTIMLLCFSMKVTV